MRKSEDCRRHENIRVVVWYKMNEKRDFAKFHFDSFLFELIELVLFHDLKS